ncbi:MAG: xanthan lyase [Bacteroidaceae bacterium]|nr:xanthan lyase [Bacteroidaceae bacterium]
MTLFLVSLCSSPLMAQILSNEIKQQINDRLIAERQRQRLSIGRVELDSVAQDKKTLQLFTNNQVGYFSFRENNVESLYRDIQSMLPADLQKKKLQIYTNGRMIEDLIPAYTRTKKVKSKVWAPQADAPLITPVDCPYELTSGLQNRHIAMWQSHGYYFEPKLNRWEWQRARIFQTVEDLYTQSYVLPFLVPMLENAGANVLLPRERDTRREELIIDNDGMLHEDGSYQEVVGKESWINGSEAGFAHRKDVYTGFDNPFRDGTYRQVKTVKSGQESTAVWTPNIPKKGEYGVYVSYKSMPNSTTDALYTVCHLGGETHFRVNQQMGGGTWIYLGSFLFAEGQSEEGCVKLSNLSDKSGRVLTADGVKIGGGMGNVARCVEANSDPNFKPDFQLSGYPRFTEGARYWLQWAGAPDSVYSESHGVNDYTDDYKCRGLWVNWLAGGSEALPHREGLHIPFDVSMAFHSDAGTTLNDTIIGTLLIYETVTEGRDTYANGASRYLAADLADLIQSQIVDDIRALHAPEWHRRGKWNSSYYEARVPEVPAILLELLSHQNFADMRYGLDPRFRFSVSRAVYKGILKFICSQRGTPYVVQPLPVDHFHVTLQSDNTAVLHWQPVEDPLESTAQPTQYLVYTRVDDAGWDNGVLVDEPMYSLPLEPGKVYSWKIAAVNQGGKSFDSEILSAGISAANKYWQKPVLVINGFDRVCAPADFEAPGDASTELAGFLDRVDHGVPYLRDISYVGEMKEFRRRVPWMDDDAAGFGDSCSDHETEVIAGNSFDYPFVHGSSLLALGQSFVSASNESVEAGQVSLADYPMVDLILGKQYQNKMGNGKSHPLEFKTFTSEMQKMITRYLQEQGGRLFTSGAYVATDLWDNPLAEAQESDKKFATEVLKFKWRANQAANKGGIKTVQSVYSQVGQHFDYSDTLNEDCYVVESPDALEPSESAAQTVMRYAQNNLSAAVAYRGERYATFTMGVPFETIRGQASRQALMQTILETLK